MRKLILLMSVFVLDSCNNYDFDINELKNEKVKFKDLPAEVAQYLSNPIDSKNDIQSMLLELPKGNSNEYSLETVETWIGPWVAYEKLISINKKITYKIDLGVPSPYIIFEHKLYIPNKYNIFTTVGDLNSLEFTRYELK